MALQLTTFTMHPCCHIFWQSHIESCFTRGTILSSHIGYKRLNILPHLGIAKSLVL